MHDHTSNETPVNGGTKLHTHAHMLSTLTTASLAPSTHTAPLSPTTTRFPNHHLRNTPATHQPTPCEPHLPTLYPSLKPQVQKANGTQADIDKAAHQVAEAADNAAKLAAARPGTSDEQIAAAARAAAENAMKNVSDGMHKRPRGIKGTWGLRVEGGGMGANKLGSGNGGMGAGTGAWGRTPPSWPLPALAPATNGLPPQPAPLPRTR